MKRKAIASVIKGIEKGENASDVFPEFKGVTARIRFFESEIQAFSEPFKTVFEAVDRTATVVKSFATGGGYNYEITFRRFGYHIKANGGTVEQAKERFIDIARGIDK